MIYNTINQSIEFIRYEVVKLLKAFDYRVLMMPWAIYSYLKTFFQE